MKKLCLLVVSLGLVLVMMELKVQAYLVIDRIGRMDATGGDGGADALVQRNERLLQLILENVNAKAASRILQPGDLIKELKSILAEIGGFEIVGDKIIDSAGNVWTLADRTEKDAQGNVVSQGKVLTKTTFKTSFSDDELEFQGTEVGMTTIAHVRVEYKDGLKVYEYREGTKSGVTDDGEEINQEFHSETYYSYNNLGMVNKIDSTYADSASDWQEVHQIVYTTSFYENGNAAEQIIQQWNADGTYVRIRRYNIVWENGEMVEWDEEVEEEAKG